MVAGMMMVTYCKTKQVEEAFPEVEIVFSKELCSCDALMQGMS